MKNIHPGEILQEEFLIPYEISAYRLSKDIGIPQTRISEILKGNRRITADTALRLSKYFGNSAKFWLGLQDDFDLEEESRARKTCLERASKIQALASYSVLSPFIGLAMAALMAWKLTVSSVRKMAPQMAQMKYQTEISTR